MGWHRILTPGDVEQAIALGKSGTMPAAPAADVADFLVRVPFEVYAMSLTATLAVVATADTILQVRRSVNGGATYTSVFGTVTIAAGQRVGTSVPPETLFAEGDLLNFSVIGGNATGVNLTLMIRCRRA